MESPPERGLLGRRRGSDCAKRLIRCRAHSSFPQESCSPTGWGPCTDLPYFTVPRFGAPHFIAPRFTALPRYIEEGVLVCLLVCVCVLPIERAWQPCREQVSPCHLLASRLRVPFLLSLARVQTFSLLYLLWCSVASDLQGIVREKNRCHLILRHGHSRLHLQQPTP